MAVCRSIQRFAYGQVLAQPPGEDGGKRSAI